MKDEFQKLGDGRIVINGETYVNEKSKRVLTKSTKSDEYYGQAMMISDDQHSVCCVVQEGTGNTKETTKLVERWFPYSAMKGVITNEISNDGYIRPQQLFKVAINHGENEISYKFHSQEETPDIMALFEKPDYFDGIDTFGFMEEEEILITQELVDVIKPKTKENWAEWLDSFEGKVMKFESKDLYESVVNAMQWIPRSSYATNNKDLKIWP
jgi:hypothetical protein